jgi:hypothetical protein
VLKSGGGGWTEIEAMSFGWLEWNGGKLASGESMTQLR